MKLKCKKTEISIRHAQDACPVQIVNDALVATKGVGDGRMIPLLILDSAGRPDFEELVRVHEYFPHGDVGSQWCELKGRPNSVGLILRFVRPAEVFLVVEIDVGRRGGVVDQILLAKALYLQPGSEGDRLINTIDAKRILIEVPETGFSKQWEEIRLRHLVKEFRGKGLSKRSAVEAAREFAFEWRRLGELRPWS